MIHNPGLYFCECFLSVFIQPSLTMMIRVAKLLTSFTEIFRLFPGEEKFIATLAHTIQNIPKLYIVWYKWHKSYSFKFDQVFYETHQSSIKCDRFQFQFQCSLNQGCWQKTEQVFGHCARFMCALMRPKSPQKWSANRVVSWETKTDSSVIVDVPCVRHIGVCPDASKSPPSQTVRPHLRPLGVFYNVLLPASLNAVQNVRFMLCQPFWFYKYDSYARYYQYTQHKVFVNIVLKTIQAT